MIFLFLLISGCSYFQPLGAESPVKEEFSLCDQDSRIRCKPPHDPHAKLIADVLEESIHQIELRHGKPFTKPVIVHLCDSTDCFAHYAQVDSKIRGAVGVNGLFLSPLIFDSGDYQPMLMHELSHLHLFQQISILDSIFIPQWFHDGVATYASGGGGSARVSEKIAKEYFKKGKSIVPNSSSFPYFPRWQLNYSAVENVQFQQHLNYRQAALFIGYLDIEGTLSKLLRKLESGDNFNSAFEATFNATVDQKWNLFLQQI